ncbi:filamentous hemagglutinin family outer membrane protein [Stanieria cyanosphaera PCC 7437]|uniref:Filamentous hemagglutinin family outer membrane protein n=1 Tax=Stanieria cyanosphaera (strain ATCC 29371 / PCC 7437) TaxID=111780 RepID=K9XVS9_STAC7|nr:CHAT domain-containing protein [Stanieria cyanosphaera]AFZ36174.1 filamentous hemagglutinin family outer membrane protein [Stanieria cyanosphaera PCC 7437]
MKKISLLFAIIPWLAAINFKPILAQSIIPGNDGTATIVTPQGNRITIDGGTLSKDGHNLFHSFQEFGLDANQIATFLSNPQIQNILSRINGGNPSVINGLIEVVGGNSNLFLMNPAGIVFGSNARLNVPGDFTATTARGIKFGDTWFNAFGLNDYVNLVGNPNGFQFDGSQAGTIINAGNLAVAEGQNLSLTAGKVVNTGTITAPGGNITLTAVPGTNLVRISQEGQVLSLEVELPTDKNGKPLPIQVKDLLDILAGLPPEVETGLNSTFDGKVQLAESGTTVPDTSGTNIVSGNLDVSNTKAEAFGGEVNVLGDKVGLIAANVDASGDAGGGKVLIGGDYKGQGTVPNADVTVVDSESVINADALRDGDGGKVIVWSDATTRIEGNINATGGQNSGNGGFVETSSGGFLDVVNAPNVAASNGLGGTWLLDPHNITIVEDGTYLVGYENTLNISTNNPFTAIADDAQIKVGIIKEALTGGSNVVVSTGTTGNQEGNITLEADLDFDGTGNNTLTLDAANDIVIGVEGDTLVGETTTGKIFDSNVNTNDSLNLFLTADSDESGDGRVQIVAPISTGGGNIVLTGTSNSNSYFDSAIEIGSQVNSGGGDIALTGTGNSGRGIRIYSQINSGGGNITLTGTSNSEGGISIFDRINSEGGDIALTGTSNSDSAIFVLSEGEINSEGGNITLKGTNADIYIEGQLNSGNGSITLTSDIIGLDTFVNQDILIGEGDLLIQTLTPDLDLEIGGTSDLETTFLNEDEIAAIQDGFRSITIGREDATGNIVVVDDISFNDNLTLQSPASGGSITVDGAIQTNGNNLTLNAGNAINVNRDIITDGGIIKLDSNGTINSSQALLDSSADENGGEVSLTAASDITVGEIDSSSDTGNGGQASLNAGEDINIGTIDSSADIGNGGQVTLNAGGNINLESIDSSSFDTGNGGEVKLNTGGNIAVGSIDSSSVVGNGGKIALESTNGAINATTTVESEGQQIVVGGIVSGSESGNGGDISIKAPENIQTGYIISSSLGTGQGGAINLESTGGTIDTTVGTTEQSISTSDLSEDLSQDIVDKLFAGISSFSSLGNGGNVTLASQGNIKVKAINAEGGDNGNGGDVNVNLDNNQPPLFQATGTFTARSGLDASISTAAGITGGDINLRHGSDGKNNPFRVGDPTAPNGTAGVITTGDTTIDGESFFFTENRSNINLISVDNIVTPPIVNPPTEPPIVDPLIDPKKIDENNISGVKNPPSQLQAKVLPPTIQIATIEQARETLAKIEQATAEKPALIYVNFTPPGISAKQDLNEDFARREAASTAQYEQSLNLPENIAEPNLSIPSEDSDVLDILVVTPEGEPIQVKVDGATRKQVIETANEFYLGFIYERASYPKEQYLKLGQQLYQSLINPIEDKLKERKINNLLFVMPTGLRLLPIAALHDGQQFLAQKYSTGMAPSLNLTNTAYQDIREQKLVAMGASQFNDPNALGPLPDAELELNTIAKLWSAGKPSLLNDKFTLNNLQVSRQQTPYGIVHIATHGEFAPSEQPDEPSEIYLQLFDKRLELQEWRNLGFNNPPVELLVLSACRTGLGNEDVEMGFAGLAVQAGVKSALGTFWYVSDRGSMALMNEFYHQLKTSETRMSKAEALRRAQAAMINGQVHLQGEELVTSWGENINLSQNSQESQEDLFGNPVQTSTLESAIIPPSNQTQLDFSHPFYWAPFTLIGNPW